MSDSGIPTDVLKACFLELEKDAGIFGAIGRMGRSAAGAVAKGGRRAGRFALENPKTTAGIALGTTAAGYTGLKAVQGAKDGYQQMSYGPTTGSYTPDFRS